MIRDTLRELWHKLLELFGQLAEAALRKPLISITILILVVFILSLWSRVQGLKRSVAALSVQSGNTQSKLTDAERTGLAVRLAPLAPPPALAPPPPGGRGSPHWAILAGVLLLLGLMGYAWKLREAKIVAASKRVTTIAAPAAPSAPQPLAVCGAPEAVGGTDRFVMRRQLLSTEPRPPAAQMWLPFDPNQTTEAAAYYQNERAAILRDKGPGSIEAAYNANNLAVPLAHLGRCAEAESLFAAARAIAIGLPLAPIDRDAIDRNYARFRAMRSSLQGAR